MQIAPDSLEVMEKMSEQQQQHIRMSMSPARIANTSDEMKIGDESI